MAFVREDFVSAVKATRAKLVKSKRVPTDAPDMAFAMTTPKHAFATMAGVDSTVASAHVTTKLQQKVNAVATGTARTMVNANVRLVGEDPSANFQRAPTIATVKARASTASVNARICGEARTAQFSCVRTIARIMECASKVFACATVIGLVKIAVPHDATSIARRMEHAATTSVIAKHTSPEHSATSACATAVCMASAETLTVLAFVNRDGVVLAANILPV